MRRLNLRFRVEAPTSAAAADADRGVLLYGFDDATSTEGAAWSPAVFFPAPAHPRGGVVASGATVSATLAYRGCSLLTELVQRAADIGSTAGFSGTSIDGSTLAGRDGAD